MSQPSSHLTFQHLFFKSGLLLHYTRPPRRHRFGLNFPCRLRLEYCSYNPLMSSAISPFQCRVQLNFHDTNLDDMSYAVLLIQTRIQLRVSHTRATILTSHVEFGLLFHYCVLCYHMMTSHIIYGFFQPLLSIQGHTCFWPTLPALGRLRSKHAHSSSIQETSNLVFLLFIRFLPNDLK